MIPDAQHAAAAITLSPGSIGQASLGGVLHQVFFDGMLVGYDGAKRLLPLWLFKQFRPMPLGYSLNPPLWTLHVEFYGSLLVLALEAVRAIASRRAYFAVCALAAAGLVASPLNLFLLGHLLARWLGRIRGKMWHQGVGFSLLGIGFFLSTSDQLRVFRILYAFLPPPPFGEPIRLVEIQGMISSVCLFLGIAFLPIFQKLLIQQPFRWLGKVSFSLYLVHYPLLFTVVSAAFVLLATHFSYGITLALIIPAGIALTFGAAAAFETCIDRPSIFLSRRLGQSSRGALKAVPAGPA
jgi:peptidoglycan/LPS O-acetylase OafA/YrhL